MPKGFTFSFGRLDLNNPVDDEEEDGSHYQDYGVDDGAGPSSSAPTGDGVDHNVAGSSGVHTGVEDQDVAGQSTVHSETARSNHSGATTSVTLSSEDSGSDGENQCTLEGFVSKTPFVGIMFDSIDILSSIFSYSISTSGHYFGSI